MIMAILAPNTAALLTPKVEGDAITLLDIVCMITPEIDNAVPASTAAIILGSLMF
jgi:hypothetical protein